MSESEARGLIERYLAAFNASDHEAMLSLVSEDVAFDDEWGERLIGKEKLRWSLGLAARHFREELSDIAVMTAPGGGRAAAEFTLRGTYLATADKLPEARGQRYVLPAGMFFEIDDGLITRVTAYRPVAQWQRQLADK